MEANGKQTLGLVMNCQLKRKSGTWLLGLTFAFTIRSLQLLATSKAKASGFLQLRNAKVLLSIPRILGGLAYFTA